MKLYARWHWAAAVLLSLVCYPSFAAVGAGVAADAYARGAQVYERCAACHALDRDRTGPRHCGLFGRRAGSVAGFPYSSAMRKSKIVWNEASLDRFLKSPMTVIPGTAMGYDGVKDDRERHDLIVYLREAGQGPECARISGSGSSKR
jgi:cytochrome c